MLQNIFNILGITQKPEPKSRYQEICEIKDRLYRDIVRLETLQGTDVAAENIHRILLDTGCWYRK